MFCVRNSVTSLGYFWRSRLQIFLRKSPNIWNLFMNFVKIGIFKCNCDELFWTTIRANWATFHFNIWSHWSGMREKIVQASIVKLVWTKMKYNISTEKGVVRLIRACLLVLCFVWRWQFMYLLRTFRQQKCLVKFCDQVFSTLTCQI